MPPGSKKRKAAKEKKQKEPITCQSHEGDDDDPRDPFGKELLTDNIGEVSSPMSGHNDEFHPITEELGKKNNKEDSPSEKKEVLELHQEDPIVANGSSLQQSETSKSSSSCSSSSSSSSDEDKSHHSHAIESNLLMTELITGGGHKEDAHYDPKPSVFLEAAQDPDGLPPFQDLDLPASTDQMEKNSVYQTDLLTYDEVVEENDIVPDPIQEVEETVTVSGTAVPSETIVTAFPKDSEKDFQSSSVVYGNDLKKTSWISCCGLFELFGASNP